MDNALFHCRPEVGEAIQEAGCEVWYLPPYSPYFNPIELAFSLLMAWVRRHFDSVWPSFDGIFGDFLGYAIRRSRCDRFIWEHFRHTAGGGIIFEAHITALEQRLQENEVQIDFES